jgi:PAS domain S-box-containing protein
LSLQLSKIAKLHANLHAFWRDLMSTDVPEHSSSLGNDSRAIEIDTPEYERQFQEVLDFSPAALIAVDEDGRLLFHNARLRELLGYTKEELDGCDTRMLWHDVNQRAQIIDHLRTHGGQLLNERVVWRKKSGGQVHLLLSYVQVAYRGGHVSFTGAKRIFWVYDITALIQQEARVAEQERQLREIVEYSPAALCVVDEDASSIRCASAAVNCSTKSGRPSKASHLTCLSPMFRSPITEAMWR